MDQPQQPIPSKSGGSLKWLLIVLVIVIVLGGGYLLYAKYGGGTTPVASPSPVATVTASPIATVNPTASTSVPADWKTYTNETYGFSFKYPNDYQYEESINAAPEGPQAEFTLTIGKDSTTLRSAIHVRVYVESTTSNLNEPNGMESSSSIDTTVDGKTAKKYVAGDSTEYVVVNNNRRFEIGFMEASSEMQNNFSILLPTFQFTE